MKDLFIRIWHAEPVFWIATSILSFSIGFTILICHQCFGTIHLLILMTIMFTLYFKILGDILYNRDRPSDTFIIVFVIIVSIMLIVGSLLTRRDITHHRKDIMIEENIDNILHAMRKTHNSMYVELFKNEQSHIAVCTNTHTDSIQYIIMIDENMHNWKGTIISTVAHTYTYPDIDMLIHTMIEDISNKTL